MKMNRITPFLWMTARRGCSQVLLLFHLQKVEDTQRLAMSVTFELDGQMFYASTAGPSSSSSRRLFLHQLQGSERGRLLLEQAAQRRPDQPVRLAAGKVRPFLAGRTRNLGEYLGGKDRKGAEAGHGHDGMVNLNVKALKDAYAGSPRRAGEKPRKYALLDTAQHQAVAPLCELSAFHDGDLLSALIAAEWERDERPTVHRGELPLGAARVKEARIPRLFSGAPRLPA